MYDFYDTSYLQNEFIDKPIGKSEWKKELNRRIKIEKQRKTIVVNYYRIGIKRRFVLPIKRGWENHFPRDYENIKPYPWDIWLMWELRERWDTFFASYVLYKDEESLNILTRELDEAFDWDAYSIGYKAYLGTAHFAMCIFRYLHKGIFSINKEKEYKEKARFFLDKYFFPWFEDFKGTDKSNTENFVHNIWVMMVFSALALCREIDHEKYNDVKKIADEMFDILSIGKMGENPITEMAAYDAFYLSTITEYLKEYNIGYSRLKDNLLDAMHSFIDTSIPGRGDILAPIGDIEPEMQFHTLVLVRCHNLLGDDEGKNILCKIPPRRLMSLALFELIQSDVDIPNEFSYKDYTRKNAGTIALRSGKSKDEILCAVSIAKWKCGHVHNDIGSFVLATKGTIIISDPGYQQYVRSDERTFDIGKYAHNCPVINGEKQSSLDSQLIECDENHIKIDLTHCYNQNNDAKVIREFVYNKSEKTLIVADTFVNLTNDIIEHSFVFEKDYDVKIDNGILLLSNGIVKAKMITKTGFNYDGLSVPLGSDGRTRLIHTQKIHKNDTITFEIHVG